jgi:hypothetical protein
MKSNKRANDGATVNPSVSSCVLAVTARCFRARFLSENAKQGLPKEFVQQRGHTASLDRLVASLSDIGTAVLDFERRPDQRSLPPRLHCQTGPEVVTVMGSTSVRKGVVFPPTVKRPHALTADGPERAQGGSEAPLAADAHVCSLQTDASVLCWGANFNGELGDGTTNTSFGPIPVHL